MVIFAPLSLQLRHLFMPEKLILSVCSHNKAILLGSIKVPYEEIKRRILEMDEENLTVAMLEQLIRYMPPQDQINKLAQLKDEYNSLAEPEQFIVVVSMLTRCVSDCRKMLSFLIWNYFLVIFLFLSLIIHHLC